MSADFDVAVIGGGSAGVAAALAAAGEGAQTLLLEASDRLGGNASLALVHTICGLFEPAEGEEPARFVHPGLPRRLALALQAAGVAGEAERAGRVHYLPIDPTGYGGFLAERCAARAGLQCHLGVALESLTAHDSHVALRWAGGEARARLVVDATGDGNAAQRLGAERVIESGDDLQFPSYIVHLSGVDEGVFEGFARLGVSTAMARAVREGVLPEGCDSVVVRAGLGPGEAFLTLGLPKLPGSDYEPLDPAYAAELQARARAAAEAVVAHLRATREPFARCRVATWPERVGLRETARVRARIELDRDDILAGRRRPDEVVLSAWPIELWRDYRRAHFELPEGPCGVPLGSLQSASHPRLAVAGRCMGGSHEALGALRVIGTALATGEAAGIACALAADTGCDLLAVEPAAVRQRIVLAGGGGP